MAERFELKIISPDEVFYEGEGTFLEFVSVEGEMGVYQNHIPLTTILEPCVMKIHNESEVKKAAILGGFVEIQKNKITVLAEDAQWPEEIDVERAKKAEERAKERLAKKDGIDILRAEVALESDCKAERSKITKIDETEYVLNESRFHSERIFCIFHALDIFSYSKLDETGKSRYFYGLSVTILYGISYAASV